MPTERLTQTDVANTATTCREHGYAPDDRWARLPSGFRWSEATAVATDSRDRVYVFPREPHRVLVFDRDGTFLASWGEGLFTRPHGICIGPDDSVYLTDDAGHTVRKFTPDGRLLLTLGTPGKPSDTGVKGNDFRTIRQAAGPFHYPCNVAISPAGDIYVCDGYGNARVHAFSPDGRHRFSWGEPGSGPGQFHLPHGIAIDSAGTVYIADRENSRVQLFDLQGKFLAEWADIARPCQVFAAADGKVYVAELGYRAGMWPDISPPSPDATGGRVSVFDRSGKLLARWGGGENPTASGDFFAPHDICVDSHGDVYVAEVTMSAGGNRGLVSAGCHSLQKFTRTHGGNS
jgi:DNA-binding beta-propeller fold protein YncE